MDFFGLVDLVEDLGNDVDVEDPPVDDPEAEDPAADDLKVEGTGLRNHDADDNAAVTCFIYFLCNIITVGGACLTLWLSFRKMRPHRPTCSIEYFYVPALNKTLGSQLNSTINFMVRFDNPNKYKGIYYGDVYFSLSSPNTTTNSSAFVANYTVPHFYQGHKKKAKKWVQVLPLHNQTVLQAVLPTGLAVFRLDLKTKVRFKIVFFKTKKYKVEVGADVEVYGDGVKANKESIKMKKSDSSSLRSYFSVCVLMNLLVFFAIC